MRRLAYLEDIPDDEEKITQDELEDLVFLRLKRYCYLGTFEPVRTHIHLPRVSDVYLRLNKYCQMLDPNRILSILETASNSKLFRRDEMTLLHVIYLLGDTEMKYKTEVREHFVKLVITEVDLFLFCKYAALVQKLLSRKFFCKTIKKAITAWYVNKSCQELVDIFKTNRSRNGFTHAALMKICRISDFDLGTKYIYHSFKNNCTTLLKNRQLKLPPQPQKFVVRKIPTAENKVNVDLTTATSSTTKAIEGKTVETETTAQQDKEEQEIMALPAKECNCEEIRSQILAISKLRTNITAEKAVNIIENFNLRYEHLPYKLLKFPAVLNKVIPSMTFAQLLHCFKATETRKHFTKPAVMKVCRERFQEKGALKGEDIDPIMCLMNLDNLNIKEPLKRTYNNKKTGRSQIVKFSKVMFRNSFNDTKPMNLRIHITINMQDLYMKHKLKNTKVIEYKYAAIALAFTFFKVEKHCDVFRWCDNENHLCPVRFKKNLHYTDAFNETYKFTNPKNKQQLWLPIDMAFKEKDKKQYDLFICIVPAATRGNKKNRSEDLAKHLYYYRRACANNAKLVIVDLCRFRRSMKYASRSRENILEICGLDVHTVCLIRDFALGNFD